MRQSMHLMSKVPKIPPTEWIYFGSHSRCGADAQRLRPASVPNCHFHARCGQLDHPEANLIVRGDARPWSCPERMRPGFKSYSGPSHSEQSSEMECSGPQLRRGLTASDRLAPISR